MHLMRPINRERVADTSKNNYIKSYVYICVCKN